MTGVSVVKNAVDYDENAEKMKKDYIAVMTEMFTDAVSQTFAGYTLAGSRFGYP